MLDLRKLNPLRRSSLHRRSGPDRPHAKAPALPPGTLVHVGEQKTETMSLRVIE